MTATLPFRTSPADDGRDEDNQCARCGSSVVFEECLSCEDGESGSDCIDDMCHGGECIHGDTGRLKCTACNGRGGWWMVDLRVRSGVVCRASGAGPRKRRTRHD